MNQAWIVVFAEVLGEESFLDADEKAARWTAMTAKQKLKAVNRYISKWLRAFNVPDEYSELMHDLHDISELLTGMVRGNFEDESAYLAHVNEEEAAREAAYWAANPEKALASQEAQLRWLNMTAEPAEVSFIELRHREEPGYSMVDAEPAEYQGQGLYTCNPDEEDRWNDGDDIIPKDSDELWDRMEKEAIEEAASSDFRVVFWEISWAWVAIYFGSRVPGEVYHSLQGPHCPSYDDYQPSEEFVTEAHGAISRETEVEAALDSIVEQPIPVLNQVARLLHVIEEAYYYKSLAEEKIADARADGFGCDFEDGMRSLEEGDADIACYEQKLQTLGFYGYDDAEAWYNENTTEKQRSSFNFAFTYGYDEESIDNPANWPDAEREEAERQQKLHEIEVFRNTTEWPDDAESGDFSVEFNGFHSPYCGADVPNEAYISLDARTPAHPLDIRNMFGVVPEPEEIQFNWAMILPVLSMVLDSGIGFSLGLIALGAMISINLIKQLPKRNPSIHIHVTEEEWLKLSLDCAKSLMAKMGYEEWVSDQGLKVIDALCLQTYMAERMPNSFADLLHFVESGKVDWDKVDLRCASQRELDEWWNSLDEEEQVFFLLSNPCDSSKPDGVKQGVWRQVPVTTAAGFCERSDKSISFAMILPASSRL